MNNIRIRIGSRFRNITYNNWHNIGKNIADNIWDNIVNNVADNIWWDNIAPKTADNIWWDNIAPKTADNAVFDIIDVVGNAIFDDAGNIRFVGISGNVIKYLSPPNQTIDLIQSQIKNQVYE